MGKLGAGELNFSSDIDLIFAYPEDGETRGGPRSVTHEDYFRRLGQRLIQALNAVTADGFVFRVDMRLRPFGDSGPLVMSFDAMEEYYQAHGREWERYAWIKAAVVAGDRAAGEQLLRQLRPFVFRRYLDFSAYHSLREMKALIAEQVKRKGLEDNIKLGAGGIREIEFIGQAFQLIRGGRETELQARPILTVLERLGAAAICPPMWLPISPSLIIFSAAPKIACRPTPTGKPIACRMTARAASGWRWPWIMPIGRVSRGYCSITAAGCTATSNIYSPRPRRV